MLINSLATFLIVASSIVVVSGQTPNAKKEDEDKAAKTSSAVRIQKTRDLAFSNGVNLPFLIKVLAREMDLNVLFDTESRLDSRQ